MDTKQLFEKVAKGYIPIYPLASMNSIVDENQSINLAEVLNKYNHIYITFQDNAKETRLLIPDFLRRYGLWISYEVDGSLYTEYFKGSNMDAQQEERWSSDEYWEYIPDLQFIEDAYRRIPSGAILPEHLSDSLQQLISQHHTINNMVDDEDLTTKDCGIIKFKDKKYEPNIASGKGYKILRKYFANGVNTLMVEDFEWQNTIYEVRYDYDLQGQTIALPKGATLLFKGGSINNGTIQFNGGTIIGADRFDDCGNASFTGDFAKGLIMSFDDTPKWWNGTEWVKFASDTQYSAKVVNVTTVDGQANATVILNGEQFEFSFEIPKGEKGDTGDVGPEGPAGPPGTDGKDGQNGSIEGFEAYAEASESATPHAQVDVEGTTLRFRFGLVRGPKGEDGKDGTDGQDGADGKDGTVPNWKTYIYIKSDSKPSKPTSTDLLPAGWSDYPNDSGQWWQCIGTVNGTTNKVTEWSEVIPVNGRDGEAQDGKFTEMRFRTSTSRTTPPDLTNNVRSPQGWTIQPPSVGTSDYLWMTSAIINPDDTLNTNWSDPVCISGEQGPQGADGPAGEPGSPGGRGQLVYPAGKYDVTKSYTTDENKAPYVYDETDGNYYVLNSQMTWVGTEQGNRTPSQDYELNSGQYWLRFDAFDAVIAKLGIIANGLIGSAVFNGDYMFSQQGINPSSSNASTTEYQNFDKDHIYDGTFTPNILFNFATGAGHLAAGKILFDASGNLTINTLNIKGNIQYSYKELTSGDSLLSTQYSKFFYRGSSNYNLNLQISAADGVYADFYEISIYNASNYDMFIYSNYWDPAPDGAVTNLGLSTINLEAGQTLEMLLIKNTSENTYTGFVINNGDFKYRQTVSQDPVGVSGSYGTLLGRNPDSMFPVVCGSVTYNGSTPTLSIPGVTEIGTDAWSVTNQGTGLTRFTLSGKTLPSLNYQVIVTPFADGDVAATACVKKTTQGNNAFTVVTTNNGSLANINFDFMIFMQ